MHETAAPESWPAIPVCVVCRRRDLHAGRTTCEGCEDRLLDQLNEIEHLWLKLPAYLERGTSGDDNVSGSRSPAMPPNPEVLDLTSRGGIVTQLQVHEDAWRKTRGFTATPWRGSLDQTLPGVVRFLRTNLDWACTNYADTDDLATDLRRLIGRCNAVVNGEKRERRFTVHCAEIHCNGAMRITLSTRAADCPQCGTDYDHEQLMRLDADFLNKNAAA